MICFRHNALITSRSPSSVTYCLLRTAVRSPTCFGGQLATKSSIRRASSMPEAQTKGAKKPLAVPRPSARFASIPQPTYTTSLSETDIKRQTNLRSVILVSPSNQILLLHRVQTSSSFPSAHVFPGGNCDSFHDGEIPEQQHPDRHRDGPVYRLAAIRETFEESGILLAKNNGFGRLIEVEDGAREEGRKQIHAKKVPFQKWLAGHGGRADVDGLIPFTRWITPTNIPKRFTTQMYVYFLPLSSSSSSPDSESTSGSIISNSDAIIPTPTSDGGIEHTAARFLPASKWISMAQSGEIILFPPQCFLLTLVSKHLTMPADGKTFNHDQLQSQRQSLRQFLKGSDPPWAEKVMMPNLIARRKEDGRNVLGLDKPGIEELEREGRRGDSEYVVLVDFKKEGPRRVEVRKRSEILSEERQEKL